MISLLTASGNLIPYNCTYCSQVPLDISFIEFINGINQGSFSRPSKGLLLSQPNVLIIEDFE